MEGVSDPGRALATLGRAEKVVTFVADSNLAGGTIEDGVAPEGAPVGSIGFILFLGGDCSSR